MVKGFDVVVIGGGIIGLSSAYYILKSGKRILLLEKNHIGSGASGACDEMILLQSKKPGVTLEMSFESLEMYKKCIGCGRCVAACPGLAIYIKDYNYSDIEALITFPFEYLPLPKIGDTVFMANRMGQAVCKGQIIKISNSKVNNGTALVTAVYPKEYFHEIVTIKRLD